MIDGFSIEELVPKDIYERRGEKAWQLFDLNALLVLEWLKQSFPRGTATVNNWKWGGKFQQSGLRTFDFWLGRESLFDDVRHAKALTAMNKSLTQHKYGRAFDVKFSQYEAAYIREWIKANWHTSGFEFAITLEEGVSWLHFDTRPRDDWKVHTFNP